MGKDYFKNSDSKDAYKYNSDWQDEFKKIKEESDKNIAKNEEFFNLIFGNKNEEINGDEERLNDFDENEDKLVENDQEDKCEVTQINEPKKDLPELNLKLNIQTGECILTDMENDKTYERKIESRYYTKEALKSQEKFLSENFEIGGEEKKYLKNIDPTILNSYLIYDKENDGKYNDSAARMYVEAVLNRAKKLAHGQVFDEEVIMPGKIEIDLRKNKEQKDLREGDEKFKGLKGLLAKYRAKKILDEHGEDRMNLAKVLKDRILNRLKFILGFGAISAGMLAGGSYYIKNELNDKHSQNNKDVYGEQFPGRDKYAFNHNDLANRDDNDSEKSVTNKNDLENENSQKDEKTENYTIAQNQSNRINLGDIVTPERYSLLYTSAASMNPVGAIGSPNRVLGVNKLACVIDGKTYSTKDYSVDEIYNMAQNAGVEVRCHLDEAAIIDGKNCIQIKEVENPSPIYVYYENGMFKYLDGKEFTGDVESGIGWTDSKDCEKSILKQQVNNQENLRNPEENEMQK